MLSFKKIIVSLSIVALSACSSSPQPVVVATSDPALEQLVSVANSISNYDRKLYEIESARYLAANKQKIPEFDMYFLPSLAAYYSLGSEWTGPIEPLIEKISEIGGLNPPRYLNVKPANDIIVYVNTDRRKLIDILADAGNQAGSRAKVTLKMKERLIQVEYVLN